MPSSIFLNYSQADLNLQYNARSTVPGQDITPFMLEYARQSAHARATLPCVLDVAYGTHADEKLDVFPAAAQAAAIFSEQATQSKADAHAVQNECTHADARVDSAPLAPLFIYLHGGYWRMLGKEDSAFMAPAFTQNGVCVVVVNYSLAPAASLTQIVQQCARALIYCWQYAHEWGADCQRMVVGGSSAGGHLAAMMASVLSQPNSLALRSLLPATDTITNETVKAISQGLIGIAPLSGLFDLAPVALSNVNDWMRFTPQEITELSPLLHLPTQPMRMVLSYAPHETDEFKRQSNDYAEKWRARGFSASFVSAPGTNHFDLPLVLNDATHPLTQAVLKLLLL